MSKPPSPATAASQAAWARVSILLNLGDVEAATAAAVQASASTHWYRRYGPYQKINRARVHDSRDIPVGWMWFEPAQERVLVSSDVVYVYGLSPQLYRFAETVTRLQEPTFRWFDLDNWAIEEALDLSEHGLDP